MTSLHFIVEYQKPHPARYLNGKPQWVIAGRIRAVSTELAEEKARAIVGCDLPVRVTGIQFLERN